MNIYISPELIVGVLITIYIGGVLFFTSDLDYLSRWKEGRRFIQHHWNKDQRYDIWDIKQRPLIYTSEWDVLFFIPFWPIALPVVLIVRYIRERKNRGELQQEEAEEAPVRDVLPRRGNQDDR